MCMCICIRGPICSILFMDVILVYKIQVVDIVNFQFISD